MIPDFITDKFQKWLIAKMVEKFRLGGVFEVWCYDSEGNLKWYEKTHNLYVSEGITYILTTIFKNGTRADPLYLGLNATNNPAAAWTMGNNGSTWTESAAYSDSTRREFVDGTIASGSLSNAGNQATFNINNTATLYGAFITTNSTKSGTSGSLLCSCNFSASRAVVSGDVLKVQYTVGAADDGV